MARRLIIAAALMSLITFALMTIRAAHTYDEAWLWLDNDRRLVFQSFRGTFAMIAVNDGPRESCRPRGRFAHWSYWDWPPGNVAGLELEGNPYPFAHYIGQLSYGSDTYMADKPTTRGGVTSPYWLLNCLLCIVVGRFAVQRIRRSCPLAM